MSDLINILRNAGESVSFVYRCRDYTSNNAVRKILKLIAMPFGLAKYFFTCRRELKREGLALVLIAKDEAQYLEEWINFHVKQGVSHFFIYDNDSSDNTCEVLRPFIESGLVTYEKLTGKCRQYDAYNIAVNNYGRKYKYMAMIDADEFLFVLEGTLYGFIDEFMNAHPEAGGLGVNWLVFGSSGHEKKTEGGVLKNFVMCAEKNDTGNLHIKTICDPLKVLAWINPHYPLYRKGFKNLDASGGIITGAFTQKAHLDIIRINHYYTKSKEEFIEKIKRGVADKNINIRNMNYFYDSDKNDLRDTEILKHI